MDTPHNGIVVSLEGISGCGKTYFVAQLQQALGTPSPVCIQEVADRQGDGIDLRILTLLGGSEDRFFRMGTPRTETFLLLALKMYDYEAVIAPALAQGRIVIEDRSIDTIAIYQSLMLWPHDQSQWLTTARTLYEQATRWRRAPDLTFLLEDDFTTSVGRAQQRSQRIYNADEVTVLHNAATLYDAYAACHQPRIVRLDRRVLSNEAIIQTIQETIRARQHEKGGQDARGHHTLGAPISL
ncbi:MAG: thymidylate kinase [Ktedonobacteraceae bacterium]